MNTQRGESFKKIQRNKRYIFAWMLISLIALTLYYGTGFGFSIANLYTHSIIAASSVYIIPIFLAAGLLGTNIPGIAIVYGVLFKWSVIIVIIFMSVYIIFVVVFRIIFISIGPPESWIVVIVVGLIDTIIYGGAIPCIALIKHINNEYQKQKDKSLEITEYDPTHCCSCGGQFMSNLLFFFKYPKYHSTFQWMLFGFNLFFLVVFAIMLIFAASSFLIGEPTHISIWIALTFTAWGIFVQQFYLEIINKVKEGSRDYKYKLRPGIKAMVSMVVFALFLFGFLVVLIYYVVVLSIFGTPVCCTTTTLVWFIWIIVVIQAIQAFMCVIVMGISVYYMYKHRAVTKFRENFNERGEFLTNLIGTKLRVAISETKQRF
jgi:hypothetical protein